MVSSLEKSFEHSPKEQDHALNLKGELGVTRLELGVGFPDLGGPLTPANSD